LNVVSEENSSENITNGGQSQVIGVNGQISANNSFSVLNDHSENQQNTVTATISNNIQGEHNANDPNLHGASEKICDAKRSESLNNSTHNLHLSSNAANLPNLAANAIEAKSSVASFKAADVPYQALELSEAGGSNAAGFHSSNFEASKHPKKRGRPPKLAVNNGSPKTAPSEQQKQDLAVQIAQSAQGVISKNPPISTEDLNVIIAVQLAPNGAHK